MFETNDQKKCLKRFKTIQCIKRFELSNYFNQFIGLIYSISKNIKTMQYEKIEFNINE